MNGVVVGCWGREAKGGNFSVKELVYPLLPAPGAGQGEEVELCVLSGLDLTGAEVGRCRRGGR